MCVCVCVYFAGVAPNDAVGVRATRGRWSVCGVNATGGLALQRCRRALEAL